MYSGNLLLAPLNCFQWTAQYGDARSITVASSAPDPVLFNADLAARALLDHFQGTAVLAADILQKGQTHQQGRLIAPCQLHVQPSLALSSNTLVAGVVLFKSAVLSGGFYVGVLLLCCAVTNNVNTAIQQTPFTWATPASSPSAALWASFGSQLDLHLSNTAAGWTCGSGVDPASPANQIAVRMQTL
jgi:hypothetical protein